MSSTPLLGQQTGMQKMPEMPEMQDMLGMLAMQAMQAMPQDNPLMKYFNTPTFRCVMKGNKVEAPEICCPGLKFDTKTRMCM